ncbi:MAG TPA: recombinase family protein [Candidatus Krumholzibacteria bacterium]
MVTLDTRPDHHNFGFAGGLYDADTGLTRFGSLSHLLTVLGELETLGVAFVSLDDGIDTQTASGRLFLQIRGALAEYEAALVRERTLAGLDAARRRGKKLGRPPALSITQTARARRMAASGQSVRYIAGVLGA